MMFGSKKQPTERADNIMARHAQLATQQYDDSPAHIFVRLLLLLLLQYLMLDLMLRPRLLHGWLLYMLLLLRLLCLPLLLRLLCRPLLLRSVSWLVLLDPLSLLRPVGTQICRGEYERQARQPCCSQTRRTRSNRLGNHLHQHFDHWGGTNCPSSGAHRCSSYP